MPRFIATLETGRQSIRVPGSAPSINAAHARARRLAHELDIPANDFESHVFPSQPVADVILLAIIIACALAVVAPWLMLGASR